MWNEVLETIRIFDRPEGAAEILAERLQAGHVEVTVTRETSERGFSDFVRARLRGEKSSAPKIGILGYLGGISAGERFAFVSDADGAIAAAACMLRLAREQFDGDVIVATHICPGAIRIPHKPVDFVNSPISQQRMLDLMVDPAMDAILSIDTTRGNRVINHKGFAISPTVKEGYILRVSEDLLDIMQNITGRLPVVFPITTQDITPYSSGVYHINGIMQPSTRTKSPVVGLAITSETAVPGPATGVTDVPGIEAAARFAIEVARAFTNSRCRFYDPEEYQKLVSLYGSLGHLQA